MYIRDVRLVKPIPKRRLHLLSGDRNQLPCVGDLGVSDHRSAGFWGTLTDVYLTKRDGSAEWMAEAYDSEFDYTIAQRLDMRAIQSASAFFMDGDLLWSILSYPTSTADIYGLPPFEDAELLFAELQHRGVQLGTWSNPSIPEKTNLVCRQSDKELVERTIAELEVRGVIDSEYLAKWSEQLWANP